MATDESKQKSLVLQGFDGAPERAFKAIPTAGVNNSLHCDTGHIPVEIYHV